MLSPAAAFSMNGIHISIMRESRNALVKGPMNDMKAEATKVSPTSRWRDSLSLPMPSFHRSFDEERALIRRAARLSLSLPFPSSRQSLLPCGGDADFTAGRESHRVAVAIAVRGRAQ